MLSLLYIADWLERHMLSCPSKKLLHIDCPGCGIQRSFVALVRGDLLASFSLYPALVPILVMLVYTAFHLKFNFKKGARNIKILQVVSAILIVCFYIYKIVNHKLTA